MIVTKLLSLAAIVAAGPTKCLPSENDCTYYSRCVEPTIPCGPKGYALGYGQKYCQIFKDSAEDFSPEGQKWVFSVMNCLQTELLPIVADSTTTCKSLRTFAFKSHVDCYTLEGASICDLPLEWAKVLHIIRNELFTAETVQQAIGVGRKCGAAFIGKALPFLPKEDQTFLNEELAL